MPSVNFSPRARIAFRGLAVIALLGGLALTALRLLVHTVVISNTSDQRVERLTLLVGDRQQWKPLFDGGLPAGGKVTAHVLMLYDAHFEARLTYTAGSAKVASFGYIAPLLPVTQRIDISNSGLIYQGRLVET